jgi:hypothetical protein
VIADQCSGREFAGTAAAVANQFRCGGGHDSDERFLILRDGGVSPFNIVQT